MLNGHFIRSPGVLFTAISAFSGYICSSWGQDDWGAARERGEMRRINHLGDEVMKVFRVP